MLNETVVKRRVAAYARVSTDYEEQITIKSILTNEKYKVDALLQKRFTVDFLTKKTKINEGEV